MMKKHPHPLTFLILVTISTACQYEPAPKKTLSNENSKETYVSMDGLWKCTPETALHFGSITLEATVYITGSMMNHLSVQGCFIWDGRFRDYWWLDDIQYVDSLRQITLVDRDVSTFIGTINEDMTRINGMVYSGEEGQLVPEDKLDFVRATGLNTDRLFAPRLPNADGSISYAYQAPETMADGLPCGSIFQHVKDSAAVYRLLEQVIGQDYGRLESLLILKDQALVLEEYFYGYDRSQLHDVFSVTKSITSLLIGIALDANDMTDISRPVIDFLPGIEAPAGKMQQKITLEQVLTMRAGFEEDDSYMGKNQEELLEHILNLPLEAEPGEKFRYNQESAYLLGGIIYSLEGKTADLYSGEKLFDPLGIKQYQWKVENGVPHCHSDLKMLPRDMAKIGLLVLNEGQWNRKQVVPATWVTQSTAAQFPESPFQSYGYHWWHRSSENQPWWKEQSEGKSKEHDMAVAIGFGGQFIFVVKDLNLVIVCTSSDYNEETGMAFMKYPMVIEKVVPLFEPRE
jgi:CubicO group peptidase (beta-lactamase class C family)